MTPLYVLLPLPMLLLDVYYACLCSETMRSRKASNGIDALEGTSDEG